MNNLVYMNSFKAAFLKSISHWIDEKQDSVTVNDYNKGTLTYSGFDAVESFGSYGFGRSAFETYQVNLLYTDRY